MFFLLGMFTCNKLEEEQEDVKTTKTVEHTSDTIRVHTTDTVVEYKTIVKRPEPDTVIKYERPNEDYHTVQNQYNDDTLSITTNTDLRGEYVDQDLHYELNLPTLKVTETDSTVIRDSVIIEKNHYPDPWELEVGLNVTGNKNYFDFGPQIGVSKNDWNLGYGYNTLHKHHRIYISRSIPITLSSE